MAQKAASASSKDSSAMSYTEDTVKRGTGRAMRPKHTLGEAHGEDIEMADAQSMDRRKPSTPKDEPVVAPEPTSSAAESPVRYRITVTDTMRTQVEQDRVSDATQSVVIKSRSRRRLEKENEDMGSDLWSFSLDCKDSKEVVGPSCAEVDSRLAPISTKSSTKGLKIPDQQVNERRMRAETSVQNGHATQHQLNQVESDRQKIHAELIECDRTIQYLKSCVNAARQQTQVMSDEYDGLMKQRENLKTECHGWREDFGQLHWQHKILEDEHLELQKKHHDHMASLHQAISDNKALQERIEQQELSVTKAQSAAVSLFSNSLSAVLPDDRIRTRFRELFDKIAEWARENAAAPNAVIGAHPGAIQRLQTEGLFRQVGENESTPNLNFDFQDDTAVDTLLNAALTKRLCQDLLEDPFWFADRTSSIPDVSYSHDETPSTYVVLKQLLNKMMCANGGNKAQVYAWRASTVQTLVGSDQAREKISASHRRYLEDKLLSRYEVLVRNPLPQSDKDELFTIVQSFGSFALDLLSQKMVVRCYYLDTFEEWPYHQADEHMEIARAVGVDDDDTTLDGRPIPVVVQPLIVGYGTHDGKDYHKSKVWSKAVVWVKKADTPPADTHAAVTTIAGDLLRLFRIG